METRSTTCQRRTPSRGDFVLHGFRPCEAIDPGAGSLQNGKHQGTLVDKSDSSAQKPHAAPVCLLHSLLAYYIPNNYGITSCSMVVKIGFKTHKTTKALNDFSLSALFWSGEAQNRTEDTRIFSPLLYRLSYLAITLCILVKRRTGVNLFCFAIYPGHQFYDGYPDRCLDSGEGGRRTPRTANGQRSVTSSAPPAVLRDRA